MFNVTNLQKNKLSSNRWVPGFYTLVILATVYLMLPMIQGAEKVFRNVLVPIAGLKEMLLLRDAIMVKKTMMKDLPPERRAALRKLILECYEDEDHIDPNSMRKDYQKTYSKMFHLPEFVSGKTANDEKEPDEATALV